MRTTLAIDDDVLEVAEALAEVENKTAGQVLSVLACKAPLESSRSRQRLPTMAMRPSS